MTVRELANHAGLSIEQLAQLALDGSPRPTPPPRKRRRRPRPRRVSATPSGGRSTPSLKEIHHAVDRWLIGETLARMDGNISHAAIHLESYRKLIRERWARVRHFDAQLMQRYFQAIGGRSKPPSLRALRAARTLEAVHILVDRWLLAEVFEQENRNVTHTAKRLNISRKTFRERRARAQLE